MSTTTAEQLAHFDAAAYDLEGTPELNGRKAKTVVLRFEAKELDRVDPDHMLLAGRLEPGDDEPITLSIRATVTQRTWGEDADEVRVVYRLEISDVSV